VKEFFEAGKNRLALIHVHVRHARMAGRRGLSAL